MHKTTQNAWGIINKTHCIRKLWFCKDTYSPNVVIGIQRRGKGDVGPRAQGFARVDNRFAPLTGFLHQVAATKTIVGRRLQVQYHQLREERITLSIV